MANLHDDSWRGTLTQERLGRYLTFTDIDSIGGKKKVTPLAAACWRGHIEVVDVLFDNPYKRANPDARSTHGRTPLYFATARSPPRNRAAVVRALLKAGADPDACSEEDGFNTPLMNAITEVRDPDVVRELLDYGASVTKKNEQGETAETLAKGTPMEMLLGGKDKASTLSAVVDVTLSVVMLIVTYTNNPELTETAVEIKNTLHEQIETQISEEKVKKAETTQSIQRAETPHRKDEPEFPPEEQKQEEDRGVIENLYGMKGGLNSLPVPEIIKDIIPEPQTPKEFVANLNNFVEESGLDKFFAPGDRFLQNLAEKATALRNDPTTNLGTTENIRRLTRLSLYQPVIYCDDSGSMAVDNKYETQRELVKRIAKIATRLVPDGLGVELRFINSRSASNLNAAQIEKALDAVSPSGATSIGTGLHDKILQPLVFSAMKKKRFDRPLLVSVITDGHPDPEPVATFKDAIVDCRRRLVNAGYDPTAVMFSISQIGDDMQAKDFLRGLQMETEIADVLYCTADRLDAEFRELRANERRLDEWLLKVLTAPIMERVQL
ncbi:hypothetical protein NM688_g263 [Phlebia brevispora]|uniref:Uncharacterized protein n=1 Tax=Phlebia brevispora TaxID=194682 RepID=A0ACC1TF95_9APHY|nr:hypothetical protein NM688_g263 [Phlebia brevispora]